MSKLNHVTLPKHDVGVFIASNENYLSEVLVTCPADEVGRSVHIEALCVCDPMEPLTNQETIVISSCKSENGEAFTHAGPLHRSSTSSSTDSDWYSVSPGEINPSSIPVTDLLLQIQEATKEHENSNTEGNTSNEKPPQEYNIVNTNNKTPSLDIPELRKTLTGRPKLRRICHICGRECPSRHKLQRHLSTHTEERPYNCKICGKAFKWTEYLSKHMRTQHGNNANSSMCVNKYKVSAEARTGYRGLCLLAW